MYLVYHSVSSVLFAFRGINTYSIYPIGLRDTGSSNVKRGREKKKVSGHMW